MLDPTELLPVEAKFLWGPEELSTLSPLGAPVVTMWCHYHVLGLHVAVGWTVGGPEGEFRAPELIDIHYDDDEYWHFSAEEEAGYDPDDAVNGVSTAVLRSVPLAHAAALMRARHEALLAAKVRARLDPLPRRAKTDRDYVHLSMAYIALSRGSSTEPIQRLGEWTGESTNTWAARLQRARSKGILLGKGRRSQIAPEFQNVSAEVLSALEVTRATRGNK